MKTQNEHEKLCQAIQDFIRQYGATITFRGEWYEIVSFRSTPLADQMKEGKVFLIELRDLRNVMAGVTVFLSVEVNSDPLRQLVTKEIVDSELTQLWQSLGKEAET